MSAGRNWDDFIDRREAERFIGREQELEAFRQEILGLVSPADKHSRPSWFTRFVLRFLRRLPDGQPAVSSRFSPETTVSPRYLIFYISGQGGVGKTTLLNRYREIARSSHLLLAESDERQKDIPAILGQFAHQLSEQGAPLKHFSERYKVYRQKMYEIENDPKAPQGWGALLGRTMVRAAFAGADLLPVARQVATLLPQDALEEQAGEWTAYLIEKAFSRDEIALLRDPVPVLTELFFKDLNEVAERTPVLLTFENFEATRPELQEWLLHLPEYKPSARIRIAIASRSEAGAHWDKLRNIMLLIRLDAFSPQEAEQFLDRYHIDDRGRRQEILEYSGRLPVIMSWLAAPGDPTSGPLQPAQNIVERFLQWISEPALREVALRASLPRILNLDILRVLLQSQEQLLIEARQAFSWLQTMPFVKPRSDGWQYHEVVRRMMLRYQRVVSPQFYRDTHASLAEFYQGRREELGLNPIEMWANEEWRKDTLSYCYHFLVANPSRNWGAVLTLFALALRWRRPFAREIVDLLCQEDVQPELSGEQNESLQLFSRELRKLLKGTLQDGFELFDQLTKIKDLSPEARGYVLAYRGECYRQGAQWEKALSDFNAALQLIPDDALTITRRSIVYILTERYPEALADLERALALDENNVWAIAMRGETYRRLERYEEALADFSRAISLDEKYAWFIAIRGETYRQMGRYEESLSDFNRALSLNVKESWIVGRRDRIIQQMWVAQQTSEASAVNSAGVPIPSWQSPSQQVSSQPPIPYPSSGPAADPSYSAYPPYYQQQIGPPLPPLPPVPMAQLPSSGRRIRFLAIAVSAILVLALLILGVVLFLHLR